MINQINFRLLRKLAQSNRHSLINDALVKALREKLYQESLLKSLEMCCWYRKLCLFYKIVNKRFPQNLHYIIRVNVDKISKA